MVQLLRPASVTCHQHNTILLLKHLDASLGKAALQSALGLSVDSGRLFRMTGSLGSFAGSPVLSGWTKADDTDNQPLFEALSLAVF